jgi:hypothetical protein
LYDAKHRVEAKAWLEYGHQYNVHAREFMYRWFNTWLRTTEGRVTEKAFKPTEPKELSVFDAAHPRPKDELDAPKLRAALTKASDEQMAKLVPKDAESLKEFKRVVGAALRAMVRSTITPERQVQFRAIGREFPTTWPDGTRGLVGTVGRLVTPVPDAGGIPAEKDAETEGDAVPVVTAWPPKVAESHRWVIWLHPSGKASAAVKGKWVPTAKRFLDGGISVCAPDLLRTGEQVSAKPLPVDKNYAGYTFGYNRSLLANRVRDVLTLVGWLRVQASAKTIHLVGWGEMGVVAILAKALAGDAVAKTAADLNQFRFENVKDVADPMMLPGAVKYGGLPAFLALCAPGEVLAHNHKGTASGRLSKAAYDAAGAADKLTRVDEKLDDLQVVEWLMK